MGSHQPLDLTCLSKAHSVMNGTSIVLPQNTMNTSWGNHWRKRIVNHLRKGNTLRVQEAFGKSIWTAVNAVQCDISNRLR
mmetsp:Transcript_22829/g.43058  ORF Transcript_22829/g.43058 Transcript_22829/m.43058 type:complete len:80 (-) Transcript_22829:1346-1585(-)